MDAASCGIMEEQSIAADVDAESVLQEQSLNGGNSMNDFGDLEGIEIKEEVDADLQLVIESLEENLGAVSDSVGNHERTPGEAPCKSVNQMVKEAIMYKIMQKNTEMYGDGLTSFVAEGDEAPGSENAMESTGEHSICWECGLRFLTNSELADHRKICEAAKKNNPEVAIKMESIEEGEVGEGARTSAAINPAKINPRRFGKRARKDSHKTTLSDDPRMIKMMENLKNTKGVASTCMDCGMRVQSWAELYNHKAKCKERGKTKVFACYDCTGRSFYTALELQTHKYYEHGKHFHGDVNLASNDVMSENEGDSMLPSSRDSNTGNSNDNQAYGSPDKGNAAETLLTVNLITAQTMVKNAQDKKAIVERMTSNCSKRSCLDCGAQFPTADAMYRHKQNCVAVGKTKVFACFQCEGKSFYCREDLRAHQVKTHSVISKNTVLKDNFEKRIEGNCITKQISHDARVDNKNDNETVEKEASDDESADDVGEEDSTLEKGDTDDAGSSGLKDRNTAKAVGYSCPDCDEVGFHTKKALRNHRTKCEKFIRKFRCSLCCKIFPKTLDLYNHKRRGECIPVDEDGGPDFPTRKKFRRSDPEFCLDCGVEVFSREQLSRHKLECLKKNSSKVFSCFECGRSFYTRRALNEHQRQCHDKKGFPMICWECGESFNMYIDMARHKDEKHPKKIMFRPGTNEHKKLNETIKFASGITKRNKQFSVKLPYHINETSVYSKGKTPTPPKRNITVRKLLDNLKEKNETEAAVTNSSDMLTVSATSVIQVCAQTSPSTAVTDCQSTSVAKSVPPLAQSISNVSVKSAVNVPSMVTSDGLVATPLVKQIFIKPSVHPGETPVQISCIPPGTPIVLGPKQVIPQVTSASKPTSTTVENISASESGSTTTVSTSKNGTALLSTSKSGTNPISAASVSTVTTSVSTTCITSVNEAIVKGLQSGTLRSKDGVKQTNIKAGQIHSALSQAVSQAQAARPVSLTRAQLNTLARLQGIPSSKVESMSTLELQNIAMKSLNAASKMSGGTENQSQAAGSSGKEVRVPVAVLLNQPNLRPTIPNAVSTAVTRPILPKPSAAPVPQFIFVKGGGVGGSQPQVMLQPAVVRPICDVRLSSLSSTKEKIVLLSKPTMSKTVTQLVPSAATTITQVVTRARNTVTQVVTPASNAVTQVVTSAPPPRSKKSKAEKLARKPQYVLLKAKTGPTVGSTIAPKPLASMAGATGTSVSTSLPALPADFDTDIGFQIQLKPKQIDQVITPGIQAAAEGVHAAVKEERDVEECVPEAICKLPCTFCEEVFTAWDDLCAHTQSCHIKGEQQSTPVDYHSMAEGRDLMQTKVELQAYNESDTVQWNFEPIADFAGEQEGPSIGSEGMASDEADSDQEVESSPVQWFVASQEGVPTISKVSVSHNKDINSDE